MRHGPTRRLALALALAALFFTQVSTAAFASTVGVLSGRVTDATSNQPLADVKISAASPSGSYRTTTDAHGFYSLTGIYADTYTVSFQLSGYQAESTPGVTVFADQVQTLNQSLSKSLKTIAVAHARSSGSAFQPTQTVDTVSVNTQQIQQFQGSTFNFDEVNLISSMPGAELDSSGYPVIHGGREYEEGFEFEGIPYTDAYSNQFTNSLTIPTRGVSSVQLTPGGGDITQASGGFGALNVVARRGTYPSYAEAGLSIGGPAFDHRFTFDYSFATPDQRFSNYASFIGNNNTFDYGNNQYPLAQINQFYSRRFNAQREFLDNFVFRFGSNNHESLQFFTDIAMSQFYEGAGGMFGNGSALCYASCDPEYDNVWAEYLRHDAYASDEHVGALSRPIFGRGNARMPHAGGFGGSRLHVRQRDAFAVHLLSAEPSVQTRIHEQLERVHVSLADGIPHERGHDVRRAEHRRQLQRRYLHHVARRHDGRLDARAAEADSATRTCFAQVSTLAICIRSIPTRPTRSGSWDPTLAC